MKVAVIGANGQLGSDLVEAFSLSHEVQALTHSDIEVVDVDSVNKVLREINPDAVVNTSAFHNVPKCETEPITAFRVNVVGPLNLAKVCSETGITLVHFSTDYVFDGMKRNPYVEDDTPNPLNVYGNTKLSGEYALRNYCSGYLLLRVSAIYGKVPCRAKGGNFVTTILKSAKEKPQVAVVQDEFTVPTPTEAIAANCVKLVEQRITGLYHMVSNGGGCSWYDFAEEIFRELKITTPLIPTTTDKFPSSVKRPLYSILDDLKLSSTGLNIMPSWREGIRAFLQKNYQQV
jgi:dTDP-4-dehydrorhamnose reductase